MYKQNITQSYRPGYMRIRGDKGGNIHFFSNGTAFLETFFFWIITKFYFITEIIILLLKYQDIISYTFNKDI